MVDIRKLPHECSRRRTQGSILEQSRLSRQMMRLERVANGSERIVSVPVSLNDLLQNAHSTSNSNQLDEPPVELDAGRAEISNSESGRQQDATQEETSGQQQDQRTIIEVQNNVHHREPELVNNPIDDENRNKNQQNRRSFLRRTLLEALEIINSVEE